MSDTTNEDDNKGKKKVETPSETPAQKAMREALKALEFTKLFVEAYQGNAVQLPDGQILKKNDALQQLDDAKSALSDVISDHEPKTIALEGRLDGWTIQNPGTNPNEFVISSPSGLGTVVREKDESISSRVLFGMAREIMQTWREETPEKIAQRIKACEDFGVHIEERRPGSWQWSYEDNGGRNAQFFSGFSSANSAAKGAIQTLGISLDEEQPKQDVQRQR